LLILFLENENHFHFRYRITADGSSETRCGDTTEAGKIFFCSSLSSLVAVLQKSAEGLLLTLKITFTITDPLMGRWTLVAFFSFVACADPVRDARVAALGPEDPAVPVGPLHRAGQPCLQCHADGGPAQALSVAGTVYLGAVNAQPAPSVEVVLIDAARRLFVAHTNEAGNFYVAPREFAPQLPLWASLRQGEVIIDMESPMNHDGDCASCHVDPLAVDQVGHVFLEDDAP
jgi:hypothetical protein